MRRLGADLVAYHHRPLDGLAPGQEFGLAQDGRKATARVPAVPSALPLGFEPGGSADALDLAVGLIPFLFLAPRRSLVHDGVGRIIRGGAVFVVVPGAGLATPTPTTTTGAGIAAAAVFVAVLLLGLIAGVPVLAFVGRFAVGV